ncbi:hypothetical protein AgCh_039025 [Apium graveolens]
MFLDELSTFPPDREMKLVIDLAPETKPVTKALHKMTPVKMRKLAKQMQEMLEEEAIRPSVSPKKGLDVIKTTEELIDKLERVESEVQILKVENEHRLPSLNKELERGSDSGNIRFTLYVMSSALSLRSILDAHKLTGPNYADWLRNLRIVLRIEKLEYVIDSPKPTEPASDAHNDEHVVYRRTARYEISKELFGCRMSEGSSVNDHVLKMINLIERLRQLGFAMDGELSQDLVLQSLPSSFSQFVVNFHMNKLDVSLPELHNMLKTAESNFPPKKSSVLLIGEGSNPKKRKRNSSKKKKVGEKTPVPPKAEDPKSKVVCFHCNKVGHWKRNCKVYLAELKKKGSETTASDSGMFMIKVNMSFLLGYSIPPVVLISAICCRDQGEVGLLRKRRCLPKSVPQTPYEIWKVRKSSLKHVKIWGCLAYVKKVDPDKLEYRSVKCSFVGYPKEILGYYFYTDHRVFVSRHATFLEKEFILEGNSGSKIELDEVQEAQTTTYQVETPVLTEQPFVEQPIHRSGRVSRQPER